MLTRFPREAGCAIEPTTVLVQRIRRGSRRLRGRSSRRMKTLHDAGPQLLLIIITPTSESSPPGRLGCRPEKAKMTQEGDDLIRELREQERSAAVAALHQSNVRTLLLMADGLTAEERSLLIDSLWLGDPSSETRD